MGDTRRHKTARPCAWCRVPFHPWRKEQRCCCRSCAMHLQVVEIGAIGFKRGWYTNPDGYIYTLAPSHPRANQDGYVLEHRLVVERRLGRYLHPRERVHHKNGIRNDNRDENLELWELGRKDPPGARVEDTMRDLMERHPELLEKLLAEKGTTT